MHSHSIYFRFGKLVLTVQTNNFGAKVVLWLGKRWPLPAQNAQAIEEELNAIGLERVTKLQTSFSLYALPAMLGLMALLGFPFYQSRLTIFSAVEDLVLTISSGTELLAIVAILPIAAILTQRIFIAILKARSKTEFTERGLESLYHIGDAASHGPDGYKVHFDYFRLRRKVFKGSLIIYVVALILSYLSLDWVTETSYHKRSILPIFNETIAHEDLVYTYDPGKRRRLNIFLADSGSLFLSHTTGRYGLISESRPVRKTSEVEAIRAIQTVDGGFPNR